jgi:valyl-tRNA synthetase
MYKDGLIYRGHRIVNWDPKLQTTVSDDEVVYKEEKAPFYTFKYGPFEIGTSRPETKFGDKYVVMHPDDKRYKKFKHGDTFEAEWINGPVRATIIKDESIDMEFGTGVMTITPWHDHTDFEIAERHGLEREQIIGFDGRLLPHTGEFSGMKIDEARPLIVAKLESKGLLVKTDANYVHNKAVSQRGGGTLEPQIKLQWFYII